MNEYKYVIKNIYTPDTDLVVIELVNPSTGMIFDFKPGQYVMVRFKNSKGTMEEKHAFSIASSPTETNFLRLGIRVSGRFTRELLNLEKGAEMIVYGPYGVFSFNEKKHMNAVFLAGGIGITPFFSAMAYATDKQLPNNLSLIYSSRTLKGATFYNEIKELENRNPNIKTLFSITDDKTIADLPGVVTERVSLETLKKFVVTPEGKTFFMCGPLPFMNAMKKNLLAFGASEDQILMEEFAMISSSSLAKKIAYLGNLLGWSALAILLPFYFIYAANTKSDNGQSLLDNLIKDEKNPTDGSLTEVKEILGNGLPAADFKDEKNESTGVLNKVESALNQVTSKISGNKNAIVPSQITNNQQAGIKNITTTAKTPTQPTSPNAATKAVPTPSTGVSGAPAPTPTNTNTVNTNTPTPTTGASAAPTPAQTSPSQTGGNVAPTPTTGVSGAPAQTAPSQGNGVAAPTPTTGASTATGGREEEDD